MSQGMLGKLPLSEVRGPKGDLDEKLAGSDGNVWLAALNRFLRKENPWASKFVVRWVVTLGLHKTPEEYEKALESNGFKIGNWARDILKKVTCSKVPVALHLTSATVAELGLTKGGTTKELHAAILAQGGQLCPAEVGPALRLLLKNQPKNEWLWIAMEALSASGGGLNVFCVEHDCSDLGLNAGLGRPGSYWAPDYRLVFVVPA